MRKLLRRIATVERSMPTQDQQHRVILEALYSLSLREMELLLLASFTNLEGRALTELLGAADEAAAPPEECVRARIRGGTWAMATFLALAGTPASPSGHGRVFTKSPEVAGEQQGKVISATLCHHIKARRNVCGDFSGE
jgi:hypothetical protein